MPVDNRPMTPVEIYEAVTNSPAVKDLHARIVELYHTTLKATELEELTELTRQYWALDLELEAYEAYEDQFQFRGGVSHMRNILVSDSTSVFGELYDRFKKLGVYPVPRRNEVEAVQ